MIERPPKSVEGRAAYYRVNERTIKRWNAKAAPLHSVEEMAKWSLTQKKLPQGFLARMRELTGSNGTPAEAKPNESWEKFKTTNAGKPGLIPQMERFAAFFHEQLEAAFERSDKTDQKFYSELFFDASNSIRQQKLAADKLGIEEGQLFTKAQLARFIRAFAFWSMRGNDAVIAELCPKMVAGFKSVSDARDALEPLVLSERFVKPFAKAARVVSESSLSGWMVETIKDAIDDYIEDGAAEFDKASQ